MVLKSTGIKFETKQQLWHTVGLKFYIIFTIIIQAYFLFNYFFYILLFNYFFFNYYFLLLFFNYLFFPQRFLNSGKFLQNEVGEVITYGGTLYGWGESGLSLMNKALLFS